MDGGKFRFLLTGVGLAAGEAEGVPNPAPAWLSGQMWRMLVHLSLLEGFHNLLKSFEDDLPSWKVSSTSQQLQRRYWC